MTKPRVYKYRSILNGRGWWVVNCDGAEWVFTSWRSAVRWALRRSSRSA
jgi:hypothetical protein